MSPSKHTPGPWRIRHMDAPYMVQSDGYPWVCANAAISDSRNTTIADVRLSTRFPREGYPGVNNVDEFRANAKLIAAAPSLLTALRAMVDKGGPEEIETARKLLDSLTEDDTCLA